jgi:hypothetical protein
VFFVVGNEVAGGCGHREFENVSSATPIRVHLLSDEVDELLASRTDPRMHRMGADGEPQGSVRISECQQFSSVSVRSVHSAVKMTQMYRLVVNAVSDSLSA